MLTLYYKGLTPKVLGGIILWMIIEVKSEAETQELAKKLGASLRGGEIIELVGDIGAGKTSFTKGLARGLRIDEDIQSPSFTISRIYDARDGLRLAHYDFYRLADAGIMKDELAETLQDLKTITVIEWADIVEGVLPSDRLTIQFESPTETSRKLTLTGPEELIGKL
jgi:tRNA threonylcarbamoyladenosine biosynthesis protein TsaE